jgi:hypothetical protein
LKRLFGIPKIVRSVALTARGKITSVFFQAFPRGAGESKAFLLPPTVALPAADFPEHINQEPWVLKENRR